MADVEAKIEQEDMSGQTKQEKAMSNTEGDNASEEVVSILDNAEEVVGGLNDNINNNGGINGDMWELEAINEMDTAAAEFLGGYGNVGGGGWGEWKHDGGETWREWEFATNYEDNDWVIDDLWIFDDNHHHPNINGDGGGDAANPRDAQA